MACFCAQCSRPLTLTALLLMVACASGDPRSDGLFGGIHGLRTGAYDARQQQQQAVLADTRQAEARERSRQLDLIAAGDLRAREIAALQQDLGTLRRETDRVRSSLGRLRADRGDLGMRGAALDAELMRTEREVAAVSRSAAAGETTAALRRREALLREEVAALHRAIESIAGAR
jgi:hypothetical protein